MDRKSINNNHLSVDDDNSDHERRYAGERDDSRFHSQVPPSRLPLSAVASIPSPISAPVPAQDGSYGGGPSRSSSHYQFPNISNINPFPNYMSTAGRAGGPAALPPTAAAATAPEGEDYPPTAPLSSPSAALRLSSTSSPPPLSRSAASAGLTSTRQTQPLQPTTSSHHATIRDVASGRVSSSGRGFLGTTPSGPYTGVTGAAIAPYTTARKPPPGEEGGRSAPAATATAQPHPPQQQQQQPQRKSIVAVERENFLVFIKILFKLLEDAQEPETRSKAQRIVMECKRRSKAGDPNFIPLMDAVERRLRIFVGEAKWRKAHLFLHYQLARRNNNLNANNNTNVLPTPVLAAGKS